MTESIQKKLLRVRPPRVRITYDVETGGAIEKRELPFIVGILADLSGDRENPENFPALKERKMTDIDRDNFNDVMKKIGPRVALTGLSVSLLSKPEDKSLVFQSMDDFDPLRVVQALPSLNALYQARSQIRALQAKAEADDAIAGRLDVMVQDTPPAAVRELINAVNGAAPADKTALFKDLLGLQNKLAANDDSTKDELVKWGFLADAGANADAEAVKKNVEDGKKKAASFLDGISLGDTADNRGKALKLLNLLRLDDAKASDDEKKQKKAMQDLLGADATGAAPDPATLDAAKPAGDASWAKALLLQGFTEASDTATVTAGQHTDPKELRDALVQAEGRGAVLGFANYLHATQPLPAEKLKAAQTVFPLIQNDCAKGLLRLRYFAQQVLAELQKPDSKKLQQDAMRGGAAAAIDERVVQIDNTLSEALSAIMHCDGFKRMEATWRGLAYLVFRTETSTMLKLRVFNATQDELRKDMEKAVEFDQSALFKMVYEAEYGTYGGFPYSLLVGGYEIGCSQTDIDFLKKISEVAASAHAPFIAAASADVFGLTGYDKLDKPRDLKKIFESEELIGWREFREMEDARYVTLALPRALLRLPYGKPEKKNTIQCEGLNFEEDVSDSGEAGALPSNSNFLWGNPAYILAERITNAFSLYSWTAAIRGVEGGGLVEGLPLYTFTSDAGTTELFCPTEVSITDRREKELNDLGFISLCHCKGTGKAAFFGGQTTNLPKKYFSDEANANARISAMLPYILAASRFAHYIKVIMRDKVGSFLTRANVESYLNTWIANYVLLDDNATQEVKSSYPLRSASVVVTEVPGEPGSYKATVFLKPHFQLEELTTSIRLVANLPK
ncbi:MAG TPA: type VI secretion system contractile sheath large subunit [Noviherbaspirillum sp.]